MQLKPGIKIGSGKYELTARLREGGQAQVWEAHQIGMADFSKDVVLKCVRVGGENEQEMQQSLLREARLAARLQHPNIVEIYDIGEEQEIVYIAMERIPGQDLEMVLRAWQKKGRSAIPWHYAATMMQEVCKGLHYAHTHTERDGSPLNLVHRDLKPSNILLTSTGYIKVIDFGIAKATSTGDTGDETSAGRIKGTPAYMSPEQVLSRPLDARSDLFALGSILYELCGGFQAFDSDDVFTTMMLVSQGKPEPLRQWIKDLPQELEELIFRLLAKEPKDRYQSAREVQRALDQILRKSDRFVDQDDLAQFYKEVFRDDLNDLNDLIEEIASSQEGLSAVTDGQGKGNSPVTEENQALLSDFQTTDAIRLVSPSELPEELHGLFPDDIPEDRTVAVIKKTPESPIPQATERLSLHHMGTGEASDWAMSEMELFGDVEPTLANKARSSSASHPTEGLPQESTKQAEKELACAVAAPVEKAARSVPVVSSRTEVVEPSEQLLAIQQAAPPRFSNASKSSPTPPPESLAVQAAQITEPKRPPQEATPPPSTSLSPLSPPVPPQGEMPTTVQPRKEITFDDFAISERTATNRPNRLRLWGTLSVAFMALVIVFFSLYLLSQQERDPAAKPPSREFIDPDKQDAPQTKKTPQAPPSARPFGIEPGYKGAYGILSLTIQPPCLLYVGDQKLGNSRNFTNLRLLPGRYTFRCLSHLHTKQPFSVEIQEGKVTDHRRIVPSARLFVDSSPAVWVYNASFARLGSSEKAVRIPVGKHKYCFLQQRDMQLRQCHDIEAEADQEKKIKLSW